MKKIIMSAILCVSLMASTAVMAQDVKKDAPAKAKTEKKKDAKACDKKDAKACDKKDAKKAECCKEKK